MHYRTLAHVPNHLPRSVATPISVRPRQQIWSRQQIDVVTQTDVVRPTSSPRTPYCVIDMTPLLSLRSKQTNANTRHSVGVLPMWRKIRANKRKACRCNTSLQAVGAKHRIPAAVLPGTSQIDQETYKSDSIRLIVPNLQLLATTKISKYRLPRYPSKPTIAS